MTAALKLYTLLLLATHVMTAAIMATHRHTTRAIILGAALLRSAIAAHRHTTRAKAQGAAWSIRLLAELVACASEATRRSFGRLRATRRHAPTQVPAGRAVIL